jgi:hypothetical protein
VADENAEWAPIGTDPDSPAWTALGRIFSDGLAHHPPDVTATGILEAWRRLKPKPVYVFCHPDDRERVTEALALVPGVRVTATPVVPGGQIYVAKDVPFTDEELQARE